MKRFLKRVAIIFAIFFIVTLAIMTLLANIYQDQIGKKIISEVNKQLKSELTVQKFDMSVLWSFPNMSANLRGVALADSQGGDLLKAGNISLRFGLFSLLSSNIKVKSVVIDDANLNIFIDRRGNANYDIFKESEEAEEETGEGPAISINEARLRNVQLIYKDESTDQHINTLVDDAFFNGQFSSTKFSLNSEAAIHSRFAEIGGLRYLSGKDLAYDAKIFVNMEEKSYRIEELELEIEGNVFYADGSVKVEEEGTDYDLSFSSDRGNLSSVMALVPREYMKNLYDLESSGDFTVQASIKGRSSKSKNPEINVAFKMDDGKVSSPRMDNPLKGVSFSASFDNGKYRNNSSSVFEIRNLVGYFNRERFEMKLRVQNLDNPDIDFAMDGVIPMESIYGLFNSLKVSAGDGEVEIKKLVLKGKYEDMINTSRISRVEAGGEIEFDDASLKLNDRWLILDRGKLEMNGNTLAIQDLKIEAPGTDVTFKGTAYNLIPVIFADSLNTKRAELEFKADLISERLDLDELMAMLALSEEAEAAPEPVRDSLKVDQIQKRERTTNLLKGSFNASIKDYNYNKIEGKDFTGKLQFVNNEMIIEGKTLAMDGRFELDGTLLFEEKPRLKVKLFCDDIDVKEFFVQTENFGQEVLTEQHLKGTLKARILINAAWDQQGNYLSEELRVLAGLGIQDGELNGFEMLESFSTFVNVKDLRDIRFTSIQNFLEIRNQRIYLPVMFIQSNALNLAVSGEHSFENEIKYFMKVNAGQILAERFRKHDPKLRPVKAKRNGFFNLHYAILGTIDDYNIKSAKRMVKSDFEISEHRKRDIQRELVREFGQFELVEEPNEWRDIDDPLDNNTDTGEPEYIWEDDPQTEEEEEFIEWDEDGGNTSTDNTRFIDFGSQSVSSSPAPNKNERLTKTREEPKNNSSIFSTSGLFKPRKDQPSGNSSSTAIVDTTEFIDWDDQ